MHSPVSGTVLRLVTESEGIVQPGAALVEVGDPARLEVVVDLLSAEAVRVRAGQRVLNEAWGGEQPLDGVVRRVDPFGFMKVSALGIEEQRVNVIIDLTEPRKRWERLGWVGRMASRWKSLRGSSRASASCCIRASRSARERTALSVESSSG